MAAQAVQHARGPQRGISRNEPQKEAAKSLFLGHKVVCLDTRKGVSGRTTGIHDVAGNASSVSRTVASLIDVAANTHKLSGPVVALGALTSPLNLVTGITGMQSAATDIRHGRSSRTRLLGLVSFILKATQSFSALESLPNRICALASGILAVSGKTISALSISARVFSLCASAFGIVIYASNAIKNTISIYETLKFRRKLERASDPIDYLSKRVLIDPATFSGELIGRSGDSWVDKLKRTGLEEFVKRLKEAFPNEKHTKEEWYQRAEALANEIPTEVWNDQLNKLMGGNQIGSMFQNQQVGPFIALGWKLEIEKAQERKDQVMKRLLGPELFSEAKEVLSKLATAKLKPSNQDEIGRLNAEAASLLPKIKRHHWIKGAIQATLTILLLAGIAGTIMLCVTPVGAVGITATCMLLITSLFIASLDLRDLINALKEGTVGKHDTKLIVASVLFCSVIALTSIILTFTFGLALAPLGLTLGICAIWALSSIAMLILIARHKINPEKVTSISQYLEYVRKEKDPTKRKTVWEKIKSEAKAKDPQTFLLLRKCELKCDGLFTQDAREMEKSLSFISQEVKNEEGRVFKSAQEYLVRMAQQQDQ